MIQGKYSDGGTGVNEVGTTAGVVAERGIILYIDRINDIWRHLPTLATFNDISRHLTTFNDLTAFNEVRREEGGERAAIYKGPANSR